MKLKNLILKLILLCLYIFLSCNVFASNISISNVSITGQVIGSKYTMIQFDITWENSWRTTAVPNNWDAAWIFVKYNVSGGAWQHAWLNNTGHINPSGSTITTGLLDPASPFNATTNPGLGAFIYRDANGLGTFSKTGVKLRWNYGANGVEDGATVNIMVFAIEMVYVPQGSFSVGSGGTENDPFYNYPTTTNPYQITGEDAITVGTTAGNLYYQHTSNNSGDESGPIPAAFPKGYNAFYCIKYEIMQQQYVDFLNSLTQTQANTRKYTGSGNRYAITGTTIGNYITTNPYVACNYLSWADLTAYLDWSGLRPMTELEFEKSCRGTLTPVPNEYAWGTTGIASSVYTLSNSGLTNENISANYSTSLGNATYNTISGGINGPVRVGIFAGNELNTGRVSSGSTYYGIMEMSGNLYERAVTVGKPAGRAFTGSNGNGLLDVDGNANASNWPGTDALGTSFRGGGWNNTYEFLQVSDRYNAANFSNGRYYAWGGRGVRSIP